MSDEIWTLDDLKGRIASFYNEKKASEEVSEETKEAAKNDPVPEKDPQEESAPGVEKHDGDSAEKTVLPSAGLETQNSDGNAENNIPGKGGKGEASGKAPNGAGEGGHTAADGDAKDDAVSSPTDPSVAKTASKAKQLADAIKDKLLKKEATEEATEEKSAETLPELPAEEVAADFDENANAYLKIANLVMQHEEGRQLVNNLADREFGREAAENLIKEAEELEMYEEAMAQEEAHVAWQTEELLKSASEDDMKDIEKMLIAHNSNISNFEHPAEVEAYELGCKQAAMAMDAGGEMPMGPEAMGGEEAGGLEDVSLDEVAQVIMEMVESGELDPQMAEQILAELAGAEAGGEEGMPPEGEMGMEGMPPEEAEKLASVDALVKNAFEEETK